MRRSLLHRLTGLFLLLAHAITGTSALPAFTTLAADLEGSHAVIVSQGEHGTQVVLHHRDHEYTPAVDDHTSAVARLIVRMCSRSEEGDHRLSSEALSSGLHESEKQVRAKKQAQSADFLVSGFKESQTQRIATGLTHRDIQQSHSVRLQGIQAMLRSVRLLV